MKVKNNQLIKKLLSLDLPGQDYAVFGSGPLYAHGLIDDLSDIDVIARGKAWQKAKSLGEAVDTSFGKESLVRLFDGKIEISNCWGPGEKDIDEPIESADIIDGVRFVNLETTLKWKKIYARDKDQKHIKLLEEYLGK